MKISEKKALSIELDHSDIKDALFNYIMEFTDLVGSWEREDMDIVFTSIRKLPGGGDELRAMISANSDTTDKSEEPVVQDKVPFIREDLELYESAREEPDHEIDRD